MEMIDHLMAEKTNKTNKDSQITPKKYFFSSVFETEFIILRVPSHFLLCANGLVKLIPQVNFINILQSALLFESVF